MKLRSTITALAAVTAALIITTEARSTGNCKGYSCNTTQPDSPDSVAAQASASPSASSGAQSTGGAAQAGSRSGSQSGAMSTATGGQAGDSQATTGASSSGSGSNLTTGASHTEGARALGLSFAPGAFTPPMAAVQCGGAMIKQEAGNIGMGLLSQASSSTDSSDCTLIQIRNAMVTQCRYASARQVEDMIVQRHLPKFTPGRAATGEVLDYSPGECAILTAPPAQKQQVLNWVYVPPSAPHTEKPPAEQAKPPEPIVQTATPKPAPAVKTIKRRPGSPQFRACADGNVPQCVPARSKAPQS